MRHVSIHRWHSIESHSPGHGGSRVPRHGGLGFANWAREVVLREVRLGVFFDTIVVCTVTGSTHAGMVAGFALEGRGRRVMGIDASATLEQARDQVTRIANTTADAIEKILRHGGYWDEESARAPSANQKIISH